MHRFTIRSALFVCLLAGGANGLAQPNSLSPAELRWIDAHPIVRFSIHEKYAPYLQNEVNSNCGIFYTFLKQLGEFTQQEFRPQWRKTEQEGLRQLANGEVDFIIDPPSLNETYLQFGSLSEAIFWGHDAVLTTSSISNKSISPVNIAYFDRGYENPPITTHPQASLSSQSERLIFDLLRNDIDALVLPIRLAKQLIKQLSNPDLQVDGLYRREPFEYRWLISHEDAALHGVLGDFLAHLDPLESRQLFALDDPNPPSQNNSPWKVLPWLSTLAIFLAGSFLLWRMRKKQSLHEQEAENLISSRDLAEKANAAKSSFLATMSHEIRTPMNAILGVQELLLTSRQFPANEKSLLKSAHASAESLLGILNQVLDLSKIEAGKLTLNTEPCCLNTLIDEVDSAFSTVACKQNLILHTSKDPRIASVLMIDALRLRQILQNLISNAIKFTDQGEIYFSISVLADDHAGQLIEFRVIDTGIGMGKEELEIALQAFEQVPGKSAQQNGTGLGLTITNHLVSSMDSQLYFESAPGFGSNIHFCVAFPRTSIPASKVTFANNQSTPSHKQVSLQAHNENRPIKALVVEDHPASRQIIALQLQTLGIKVSVCDNANAALQLIATDRFDLLMTDQSMPGMQGSELAKQVRSLGHHKLIIVGITADIYALDSRHEFLAAGMNGVLIKPLSILTLENELSRYFTVEDESEIKEGEYSFDVFANLLRQNPKQILVILDEIKRVHDDSLEILKTEPVNEATFMGILHKIKGGAQLVSAPHFIESCESLEKAGAISDRVSLCIDLLEAQNRIIERYKAQYAISE